ncbi:carboxypeptidase regulatory-like domain-containing protein [Andreprevotia chitinilytica]|uniref:carboxypeptidase regulatory-like domain-containing protein n=1 Tax=Andreprevotia chitinilytica TaxID=396808 RepID=UPI00068E14FB|nr:carboxypeptidase regulatory-like domain-containing protein [Andreprevotia chitinilytica]
MKTIYKQLIHGAAVLMLATSPVFAERDVSAAPSTFISGGVGDSDASTLKAMRNQYNVHMLFTEKSGAYLSGLHVQIANSKGDTVLDTVSEGPFLYARLPDGRYRISVALDEQAQQRILMVRGGKSTELHVAF